MVMTRKFLFLLTILAGTLIFLAGAGLVLMYLWHGVITRIGEADQSLIFWYLPILFMGLIGLAVGWALGSWAWERLSA